MKWSHLSKGMGGDKRRENVGGQVENREARTEAFYSPVVRTVLNQLCERLLLDEGRESAICASEKCPKHLA